MKQWGVKHRRYLHQHPELALQEKNTSSYCKSILESLDYEIKDCWGYGFIADLEPSSRGLTTGSNHVAKNKKSGFPAFAGNDEKQLHKKKRIAFRADMDALPIQGKNAHMCGHDVHMAIALSTAKLLKQNIDKLNCNVRFIFQPSEEELPGGALGMIENGCLENVDEIYGLHNSPQLPVGNVALRIGSLLASAATFDIIIKGKGCHAACPQNGLNPVTAAACLINELQMIPILTITRCHGGDAYNIIPETVEISGTIRTLKQDDLPEIKILMEQAICTLNAKGYQCEFNYHKGYDCVINQAYGVERVVNAAKKVVKENCININAEPLMVSEDFCYYLQKIPGAFYFLGSGNKAKNIVAPLHSPYFDVDEDVIQIGAEIMAEIALGILK